jgi:transposase-like protein
LEIVDASRLSYSEIARRSGVSSHTIYKWRNGSTKNPQRLTRDLVVQACQHKPSEKIVEVLKVVEASGLSDSEIARRSGVTTWTLYQWRHGETKKPQRLTVDAVLRVCEHALKGK